MSTEATVNQAESKADFWRSHIESCTNSSLTQVQYCRNHSLALSTFSYWKRKLKITRRPKARFYPLTVQPEKIVNQSPRYSSGVSLNLCNDKFRIDIAENFSATTLKRLIVILEQA
jgi:hypothetical protein